MLGALEGGANLPGKVESRVLVALGWTLRAATAAVEWDQLAPVRETSQGAGSAPGVVGSRNVKGYVYGLPEEEKRKQWRPGSKKRNS